MAEGEEAVRTGVEVEGALMEGVDGEVAAIAGEGAAVTGIVTALHLPPHPQATVGLGALRFSREITYSIMHKYPSTHAARIKPVASYT